MEDMPAGSAERARFVSLLKRDISEAVGKAGGRGSLHPSRIEVTGLRPGSVIVDMVVRGVSAGDGSENARSFSSGEHRKKDSFQMSY